MAQETVLTPLRIRVVLTRLASVMTRFCVIALHLPGFADRVLQITAAECYSGSRSSVTRSRSPRLSTEQGLGRQHAQVMRPFRLGFLATNVFYRPLTWSCYGREHAGTTAAVTAIARRAARRQGLADHRRLRAHFRAAVGVALAQHSARMVHACLRQPPEQGWQ